MSNDTSEYFVGVSDVADRVVERMAHSMIPSAIPKHIGDQIKKATEHGQIHWQNSIPLYGPDQLLQRWILSPDGSITLELLNCTAQIFWRGTFRPVS